MTKEDQRIIEYTSQGYEEYAPFVIGKDFECFNIQHSTTTRNNANSYTDIISTHEPDLYAIHISTSSQLESKIDKIDLKSYYWFKGGDTIEHFMECLIDIQEKS